MIEEFAVRIIARKYNVKIPVDLYKNDWFGDLMIRRRIKPEVFDNHPWLSDVEKCEDYEQCAEIINSNYEGYFQMNKEGNITQLKLVPFADQYLLAALFSEKIHWFMFKLGRDSIDEALLRDPYHYKYDMRIKWDEKDCILKGPVQYRFTDYIIDTNTHMIIRETGCLSYKQMIDWGTESLISEHYNTPEVYAIGSFDEDGNLKEKIHPDNDASYLPIFHSLHHK